MGSIIKDEATYNPPPAESQWLKFEEGTTTIRLLSHSYYFISHYVKSENKGYDCTGFIETCQWCQKGIQQRKRWSYVVLVRGKPPAVKVAELGWTVFKTILDLSKDEDYGDPRGYDIKITRTGTGMDTTYSVIPGKETEFTDEETALLKLKKVSTLDAATDYLESNYSKADNQPKTVGDMSDEEIEEIFDE